MKKIILTGGGSAGHVVGNIALLPGLRDRGYEIKYIGSYKGIEKEMIEKENIPYISISTGKIHRYLTVDNLVQPFKVLKGITDAMGVLKKEKPDVIFSKGGFVSVPVAVAAKFLKIPFIAHESDLSMGLANKVALKFTDKILVTFPQTLKFVSGKGILVGSPIRGELLMGNRDKGLEFLNYKEKKELLLIMGGSLGSRYLNSIIRDNLDYLLNKFNICHLTGKGNIDESLNSTEGYRQFEFLTEEIPDILNATDFVVSRSGSNSIYEFLKLEIPALLIPLDLDQSRGDQIENAESFAESGYALMIREADLNNDSFINKIEELIQKSEIMKEKMRTADLGNALEKMHDIIDSASGLIIKK